MDRGTYVSASLGVAAEQRLEIVNNNLANVNTPGFKKQMVVGQVQTFDQTLAKLEQGIDPYAKGDHDRTPGVTNLETRTDFSLGPIKYTGNRFDVALTNPNDFFVVNTPSGIQYTRAGNFTVSGEGSLVTADGLEVQGDGGAITINGAGARLTTGGAIMVNGVSVGRLQVARFDDPQVLRAAGGTRFSLPSGAAAPQQVDPHVATESLEMSNTSTVSSMIDLLATTKGFEAYTRTAQTIDQMNQTAISQVGKLR